MRLLILTALISIAFQLHAGELIILDNYQLEKSKSSISNFGVEQEQERSEAGDRRKTVERGEEIDTQVDDPDRNIDSFKIKKIKEKREINDPEDSPLIEYQF